LNLVKAVYAGVDGVDTNILVEHEIYNFESLHHSGAGDLEISYNTTVELPCNVVDKTRTISDNFIRLNNEPS